MSQLIPCAACSRHVRATETTCPFCAASVTPAARPSEVAGRLGRAALFAFQATTVAASLNACGPTSAPPTTVEPPPQTTIMQPYGAPPLPPPTTVTPPPPTTEAPPPTSAVPATEVPPEAHSEEDHPPRMHVLYGAAPAPDHDHGRTLQAAYGGAPERGPDGL